MIGDLPADPARASAWERAAGTLNQHQVAYDIVKGLGPKTDWRDETSYPDNRKLVVTACTPFLHPRERERELDLGIGR